MNIKQAGVQIKNALRAYLKKDEYGNYMIPADKQRPVFLVGAPGIGKTALMEQIARELGVGLVSYSMTHHTRQSALGLPFLSRKQFGGREYQVSEYTMSEIIGSVYSYMEKTGKKEGILFLDEINCVSETLAPAMLQFLQYKIFGTHQVPSGWIVVTAGNPPEYNRSVREFDIATLDRVKKITVEPDYDCWREYAVRQGIHPAVLSYLDARNGDFYRVETAVSGKSFVTARGWEDLSRMIRVYEAEAIPVDGLLTAQYLQNGRIAADFADYYELFCEYKSVFNPEQIARGRASEEQIQKASAADWNGRLSLTGLLWDYTAAAVHAFYRRKRVFDAACAFARDMKKNDLPWAEYIRENRELLQNALADEAMDRQQGLCHIRALDFLENSISGGGEPFAGMAASLNAMGGELNAAAGETVEGIGNIEQFLTAAFGEGRELLLLRSAMTEDRECALFSSEFGACAPQNR